LEIAEDSHVTYYKSGRDAGIPVGQSRGISDQNEGHERGPVRKDGGLLEKGASPRDDECCAAPISP
jgi:hypothetical protein